MQSLDQSLHRPLRLGLVGGGPGSNIGATHRQAARLARRYDLVAVEVDPLAYTFPTVEDGVLGVEFVEAAVESHRQDGRWVTFTDSISTL